MKQISGILLWDKGVLLKIPTRRLHSTGAPGGSRAPRPRPLII
ncbi:hypothetical protein SB777_06740 [Burkholderia sp. SIMBA_052]